MPPPPPRIAEWLRETYPMPIVDQDWLVACYTWLISEHNLDPARDMRAILDHVNAQLLGSDFADSMVPGTGFPPDVLGAEHAVLRGPILVEVTEIMEIGHSAYSLLRIHESRVEYRKQAALREAKRDEREGEHKPMPKYPRSMLQLTLSDGESVIPGIEFSSLPQFELGETPLGIKMVLRNVTIRRGVALLEPTCIVVKGHHTADRDERREAIFVRGLKLRLGSTVPEHEDAPAEQEPVPEPVPAHQPPLSPPATAARPRQRRLTPPPPHLSPARSPLSDISPPQSPTAGPSHLPHAFNHANDAAEPRRCARKLPDRSGRSPSPNPPPRTDLLQRSRYFGGQPAPLRGKGKEREGPGRSEEPDEATVTLTGPGSHDAMKAFARTIGLSPPRKLTINLPDSDGEGEEDERIFARAPPSPPASSEVRPLDVARAKAKEKARGSKDRQKEKEKGQEPLLTFGDSSSGSDEYEFNFDMDENFFKSVAQVEEEAIRHASTHRPASTIGSRYVHGATAGAASKRNVATTGMGTTSAATSQPSAKRSTGRVFSKADVINISDDDEEPDKENTPVATRNVRRRVVPPEDSDVIELSD